jgi:hypothetical protein
MMSVFAHAVTSPRATNETCAATCPEFSHSLLSYCNSMIGQISGQATPVPRTPLPPPYFDGGGSVVTTPGPALALEASPPSGTTQYIYSLLSHLYHALRWCWGERKGDTSLQG